MAFAAPPTTLAGGDAFHGLVCALIEEYARVVRERDAWRQRATSGVDLGNGITLQPAFGGVVSLGRRQSPDDPDGAEVPLEAKATPPSKSCHPTMGLPLSAARQVTVLSALSHESSCVYPSDYDDTPQTPRVLRGRGDGCTSGDIFRPVGSSDHQAMKHETNRLELHTRWLDLYVANQMKVDIMVSEEDSTHKQTPSRFGKLLRMGTARDLETIDGAYVSSAGGAVWRSFAGFMNADVCIMPHDKIRILWDVIAVPLILHDVLVIPVQLAWDQEPNYLLVSLMLSYWFADILFNFNTAYSTQGEIIATRLKVAKAYLGCRFWFDLLLVLLDVASLVSPAALQGFSWYKAVRALRALRILRALKLGKAQETLEHLFLDSGIERLLLLFAVSQTLVSIFLIAHLLSCGWYYLGRAEEPGQTWLTLLDDGEPDSIENEYLHCLYWALGHIVGGQVNPDIRPITYAERVYCLCMVAISLIVVGAGISKMTNTIAELQRANMEAKDTRRKLSQVLRASHADADLSARILRFGMHVFRRKASLSLESSVKDLLSAALACELTLSQRSRHLMEHPLLYMIRERFHDVYPSVCEAFESHIYAEADVIFRQGSMAERLYMTVRGDFKLTTSTTGLIRVSSHSTEVCQKSSTQSTSAVPALLTAGTMHFSGLKWLCEISLFASMVHKYEMSTASFADAFTLQGDAFVACVAKSPRCIAKVYFYAASFVRELVHLQSEQDGILDYELLPVEYSKAICEKLADSKNTDSMSIVLNATPADREQVALLLDTIMDSRFRSHEDLADRLQVCFPELEPDGIYASLNMLAERKRAMAAMMSVVWLLQNEYEMFTASQSTHAKMSRELWKDIQRFVRWVEPTKDMVHGMLVLLAIRGIGKAPPLLQAMPREYRTPEDVMAMLMEQTGKLPSYEALEGSTKSFLDQAVEIHRCFNFAQLIQGENCAFHIAVLQRMVESHGTPAFKFYLFSLVGVMCGLRGTDTLKGSLFLDHANGSTLMAGINMLRKLEDGTPLGIYWGYIGVRAGMVGLPFFQLEDLAIARLACLTRATSDDIRPLIDDWNRLTRTDREFFMQNLLGDGLTERTFVFTFLPAYLVHAKTNKAVGLFRAFVVLVELLDILTSNGHLETSVRNIVTVNLQDLAEFTQMVESSSVFMAVPGHSSFVPRRDRLDCLVSAKHKEQSKYANWSDDPTTEMRALIRRMDRKIRSVSGELEKFQMHSQYPSLSAGGADDRSL